MSCNAQSLIGSQIAIGLSSVIGISFSSNISACQFKMTSGGTLFAGVTAGGGWGAGYVMDIGEIINVLGVGSFYLAAQGATCTGQLIQGVTS